MRLFILFLSLSTIIKANELLPLVEAPHCNRFWELVADGEEGALIGLDWIEEHQTDPPFRIALEVGNPEALDSYVRFPQLKDALKAIQRSDGRRLRYLDLGTKKLVATWEPSTGQYPIIEMSPENLRYLNSVFQRRTFKVPEGEVRVEYNFDNEGKPINRRDSGGPLTVVIADNTENYTVRIFSNGNMVMSRVMFAIVQKGRVVATVPTQAVGTPMPYFEIPKSDALKGEFELMVVGF